MILAVDSTSDRLTVAARDRGGRTAERMMTGARQHAAAMAPLALEVLRDLGATPAALEGIAIADGPGSFTGLRVAAAFAKAVARARGLPVWTASTLAVRAWSGRVAGEDGLIAGVGSALRGELYVGVYRLTGARDRASIETILGPTVLRPGAPLPHGVMPVVVVGDVAPEHLREWPWAGGARVVGPPDGLPKALALLEMVEAEAAVRIDGVALWEPRYGRPAEAQARWERAHGKPLDPRHPA